MKNEKRMKLWVGLVGILLATAALATVPKVWSTNEKVKAVDLNQNFQHMDSGLRNSAHTLLSNADIAGGAAIAHSKLATPALVAKGWADVGTGAGASTACTTATCTIVASSGVTSITRGSQGNYTVTIPVRANVNYTGMVTSHSVTRACYTDTYTTTTFALHCTDYASAAQDAAFSVLIMDNDN